MDANSAMSLRREVRRLQQQERRNSACKLTNETLTVALALWWLRGKDQDVARAFLFSDYEALWRRRSQDHSAIASWAQLMSGAGVAPDGLPQDWSD